MRRPQSTNTLPTWSLMTCGALALAIGACAYSPASMPGGSGSGGKMSGGTGGTTGTGGASTGSGGANVETGSGGSNTTDGGGTGGSPADGGPGTGGMVGGGMKNTNLTFTKITIHNRFLSESVAVGDYNHDGMPDVAAGKRWYSGPFAVGYNAAMNEHIYRDGHDDLPVSGIAEEINTGVSDSWSAFGYDINGDGWDDIIQNSASDIGPVTTGQTKPIPFGTGYWYQNPKGAAGNWPRFTISSDMKGEHKIYADMTGDGKPEILGACKNCNPAETWGYWQADWANPTQPWTFHSVTRRYQFKDNCCGWLHGLGAGDVNGDGTMDLLERSGIWLQPKMGGGMWTFINIAFSIPEFLDTTPDIGGSHMQVYDVDGDGMMDIISSSNSHGYGLAWFKQGPAGTFTRNMITPAAKPTDPNIVAFSQLHSLVLEDMDGDGLKDIVTGKTFLAHPFTTGDAGGGGSAGVGTEPTVLYIFKLVRNGTNVTWEPHLIDIDKPTEKASGVAREFEVRDMNKDGVLDIIIGSKRGLFIFMGKP